MRRSPALAFLLVTVFVDLLGLGIVVPVLPALMTTITRHPASAAHWSGLIDASFGVTQFLAAPRDDIMSGRPRIRGEAAMTFDSTRRACYTGYVTQAIVNNLAPLLFIVFQTRYALPLEMLGRLVLVNFAVQLLTDIVAARVVDRVGYRRPLVLAHVLSVAGLVMLAVLPAVLPSPYLGLSVAVVVYAVGGGLLEVLVSPVVDALPVPAKGKAARMSLLHSFYCWGQVAVVAGTTLLLGLLGQSRWYLLPLVWALVPMANLLVFLRVPLPTTVPDEHRTPVRALLTTPAFVAAVVLMLCAGAAELTMSQWSSLFAEEGLGVSKIWGDLAGPCLFAVLMGVGRVGYGLWGGRIPLAPALGCCGALATTCYLVAVLARSPVLSLIGCALCGLAVSLLWPGTFSLAAAGFPLGGAAMFGVLAVFGDAGGAGGPWIAGAVAETSTGAGGVLHHLAGLLPDDGGSGLRVGLLVGTAFPVTIVIVAQGLALRRRTPALAAPIHRVATSDRPPGIIGRLRAKTAGRRAGLADAPERSDSGG